MNLINIKFKLTVAKFEEYLTVRNHKSTESMATKITELLQWLESRQINQLNKVSPKHIEEFMKYVKARPNHRTGEPLKSNTLKKFVQAINRFAKYIQKTESIRWKIPSIQIEEDEEEFEPNILTEEQVVSLFKACDLQSNYLMGGRDKALLTLLFYGAMRASEVGNLRLSDINLAAREILILSDEDRSIKGRVERTVILTTKACEFLNDYLINIRPMLGGDNDHVIVSERGGKLDEQNFKLRMRKLQKLTGDPELQTFKLRGHDLRGTFGSICASKGLPLELIKKLLGHKSTDATQKYLFINKTKKQ